MPRNLEYKAKVRELDSLEKVFGKNGAHFVEVLKQTDTYFRVSNGRLKVRETVGKTVELIFYERDETSTAEMESLYEVVPIRDLALKEVLTKALGVKVVVEKERRLLKLKNARIHLDDVRNLGRFLEFEVITEGNDREDVELLDNFKKIAAPFVEKEINLSYSDLALSATTVPSSS